MPKQLLQNDEALDNTMKQALRFWTEDLVQYENGKP